MRWAVVTGIVVARSRRRAAERTAALGEVTGRMLPGINERAENHYQVSRLAT
jgi:hypothetical protein